MDSILHCVLDEKFIDSLIELTKECEVNYTNSFVCVTKERIERYKYIKNTDEVENVLEDEFVGYLKKHTFQAVVIHSLYALPPHLILKIPKSTKIAWVAWGYDIYQPIYNHRPFIKIKELYHKRTRLYRQLYLLSNVKRLLFWVKKKFLKGSDIERAIARIDYFSGIIPEEYDLMKVDNPFLRAEFKWFSYGGVKNSLSESKLEQPFSTGHDILIGNSADETNNHLDVFYLLSGLKLNKSHVICPLSYAGTKEYLKAVEAKGKKVFGNSFIPLKDFVSFEDYMKILDSVQYSIFYIERQQAMGNIYRALWYGNMVFLSETSLMYSFFKNRGFIFYSIQRDLWRIEKGESLSVEQKKKNRKLLLEIVSFAAIKKRDEEFFEIILSTSN